MQFHIMGGSITIENGSATMGCFFGESEWSFSSDTLRYIRLTFSEGKPQETVLEFAERIYRNSTGCLVRGGFAMNDDPQNP